MQPTPVAALAGLDGSAADDPRLGRIPIAEALSYRRIQPGKSAILMGPEEAG